jgi:hypothetical protein
MKKNGHKDTLGYLQVGLDPLYLTWYNFPGPSVTCNLETDLVHDRACHSLGSFLMARWPSGLRRQTKVHFICAAHLIRKGVGSNPTLVTFDPWAPNIGPFCSFGMSILFWHHLVAPIACQRPAVTAASQHHTHLRLSRWQAPK